MSKGRLALALIAGIGATSVAAGTGWTEFRSSSDWSAAYPSAWSRIDAVDGQLDVLSPGKRDGGVVIGPRQAEIIIDEMPTETALHNWKQRWMGGTRLSVRSYRGSTAPDGCGPLSATTLDFDEGGVPRGKERDVVIRCKARARNFGLVLRHWEADPRTAMFLTTGLQMARSVRAN